MSVYRIFCTYSKDQQLLPMAEQLKTTAAAKLSRRKQTSKTIKRNKQHDTIEKFKDKKVINCYFLCETKLCRALLRVVFSTCAIDYG